MLIKELEMKRILFIIILLLIASSGFSQIIFDVKKIRYGAQMGLGYSYFSDLKSKKINDVQKDYDAEGNLMNWQFGLIAEAPILDYLDAKTGLVLSKAGFTFKQDSLYGIVKEENSKILHHVYLTYLKIPIIAQAYPLYFLDKKYRMFTVGLGPYVAFNIGASRTKQGREDSTFDSSQIYLLNFGTEIQLSYVIMKESNLKVDFVVDLGLININNGFVVKGEESLQTNSQQSTPPPLPTEDFKMSMFALQVSIALPLESYLGLTEGGSSNWWE